MTIAGLFGKKKEGHNEPAHFQQWWLAWFLPVCESTSITTLEQEIEIGARKETLWFPPDSH